MSSLAAPSATQTTLTPSPTSTWHVGISPIFPTSLILSDDAAIEALLTDIPFLSVGLLGFGVLTFFFAMRKFNRLSIYVFSSVIVAFIAGVFNVGQVLTRGRVAMDSDTNVLSVLPLLVARELALSISIGIRFFFFWTFVSQPPRGELPLLSRDESPDQMPIFLRMESDIHGGNWMRLGHVGVFLKYSLLLAVFVVPVLQILWRVVADLSKPGPVYDADSSLEIAISALFVIKLFANAWLSPLTPRWRTVRDYSPVIVALLIGLGVSVGNILQFQFSETSLGRFFQAVELYILVLYVHIASFYERRTRTSMLAPPTQGRVDNDSMAVEDIKTRDRISTFQMNPATTMAPRDVAGNTTSGAGTSYSRPNNRLSSWLIPETDQAPVIPDISRRTSIAEKLTSWMTDRRNSAREERAPSRLWISKDVESGTLLVDTKTGFVMGTQQLERITGTPDAPSSRIRNGVVSPDGTIASFAAVENHTRNDFSPPVPTLRGSPVYGLDGIVRYYGQPSPLSRPSSVQSSGMASLLRQQVELDQSVAELQLFSPTPAVSGERPTVPGGQPSSVRSDFSLSIFPDPPPTLPRRSAAEDVVDISRGNGSDLKSAQQADTATSPFPIPQSTVQPGQRQSVTSTSSRSSGDAAVMEVASRTIVGSSGYDVTSFIGNLTTPSLLGSLSEADKSRRSISLLVRRPDEVEDVMAAQARPEVTPSLALQAQAPPLAVIPEVEANLPAKSLPPRRMKQGLPSGVKLSISHPIPQPGIEKPTAYERPRPVPPTS